MRKSERRQLQAVLTEMKCKIKTEVLTDLLDKAVSHALMETVYMRCKRLHQRIVMALNENINGGNKMTEMNFNVQESKEKSPVFQMEQNGVSVTVTFAASAGERSTKETILELLTNAYEKRIRQTEG